MILYRVQCVHMNFTNLETLSVYLYIVFVTSHPRAFSGQSRGWKTRKRVPWQCTASVCVAGVHWWEISLG